MAWRKVIQTFKFLLHFWILWDKRTALHKKRKNHAGKYIFSLMVDYLHWHALIPQPIKLNLYALMLIQVTPLLKITPVWLNTQFQFKLSITMLARLQGMTFPTSFVFQESRMFPQPVKNCTPMLDASATMLKKLLFFTTTSNTTRCLSSCWQWTLYYNLFDEINYLTGTKSESRCPCIFLWHALKHSLHCWMTINCLK